MSKIRVAIFPGHGGWDIPNMFKGKIEVGNDWAKFRIELAKLVAELPSNCDEDGMGKRRRKIDKKGGYLKLNDSDVVYFNNHDGNYTFEIEIKEIDNDYPCRVYEHDGAEYLEQFKGD